MKDHLDPRQCPGAAYFERKEKEDGDRIRKIFTEVVGDIPKHMKMAGENRVWLWILSVGLIGAGLILLLL